MPCIVNLKESRLQLCESGISLRWLLISTGRDINVYTTFFAQSVQTWSLKTCIHGVEHKNTGSHLHIRGYYISSQRKKEMSLQLLYKNVQFNSSSDDRKFKVSNFGGISVYKNRGSALSEKMGEHRPSCSHRQKPSHL